MSLFVSEPEVVKPIWLGWDERGRLWIAETVDYPNELKAEGEGQDRLKICEDTNGDGRADKFIVFADKLSIPTGFVFANASANHGTPAIVLPTNTVLHAASVVYGPVPSEAAQGSAARPIALA